MYRYIGLIWNPENKRSQHQVQMLAENLNRSSFDWQPVFRVDGLFVLHNSETVGATDTYKLDDQAGVVLGKVFASPGQCTGHPDRLFPEERFSRRVIDTGGQHLVDYLWGRYVAFLWDRNRRRHYVLRDPTGGIPCIFTAASGIRMFMSGMEEYVAMGGDPRRVNWGFLTALFWNLRLISRDTGFSGVSHLYAGERITIDEHGDVSFSFAWQPAKVIQLGPTLEDADEARAALKCTVRYCIASWASPYARIVHQLSGGLDSSIVAACLSTASDKNSIVCVNLSTEAPEGDERYFARLAASKFGLKLIETMWSAKGQVIGDMLDSGKHYSPIGLHSETDRILESLIEERDTTAIFSGQGGDHLFHQHASALIAEEYVFRHGLRPRLLEIVSDASRLTRRSVWPILGIAILYGLLRRSHDACSDYRPSSLLAEDARSRVSADFLIHPWLSSSAGLPASKVEQIGLLVDSQHFYLRGFPFADTVHPLISQPVIDCCLRIPSYVMTRGGIRRSLIREAFQEELPSQIKTRTAKAGTTSYLNRLAVNNIDYLRALLLNGLLASSGVLNMAELERQLSERSLIRGALLPDVLLAARVEAWLRGWARTWPDCAS